MLNDTRIMATLAIIFGAAIAFTGIVLVATAKRTKFNETAQISINALAGMVFFAIGLGAIGIGAFGKSVLETIFK